jgi:hypothetical protein
MPRAVGTIFPFGPAPSGIQQGPQRIKPIRSDQTGCYKFPQGLFHFSRQMSGPSGKIWEKTRTSIIQAFIDSLRDTT